MNAQTKKLTKWCTTTLAINLFDQISTPPPPTCWMSILFHLKTVISIFVVWANFKRTAAKNKTKNKQNPNQEHKTVSESHAKSSNIDTYMPKLQASLYNSLPPTTAITTYTLYFFSTNCRLTDLVLKWQYVCNHTDYSNHSKPHFFYNITTNNIHIPNKTKIILNRDNDIFTWGRERPQCFWRACFNTTLNPVLAVKLFANSMEGTFSGQRNGVALEWSEWLTVNSSR